MDAVSTQLTSKRFETVRKGDDSRAVDAYLAKVGDQVAKLEDELRVTRSRVDALEKQSRDVRDADTVVKTAFLAAANSKAKLISHAEDKAAAIIAEAEAAAERMVESAASDAAGEEATALLEEAERLLEEAERQAAARREEAERDAIAIIEAARSRVAGFDKEVAADVSEAAEELQRLMTTLGALKETARDGLQQVASIEADIDAVVAERP